MSIYKILPDEKTRDPHKLATPPVWTIAVELGLEDVSGVTYVNNMKKTVWHGAI